MLLLDFVLLLWNWCKYLEYHHGISHSFLVELDNPFLVHHQVYMAPKMSVTLPESGEPIVAPSICVKNLESKTAEFEDIVICSASKMHSVDGDVKILELSLCSTALRHL